MVPVDLLPSEPADVPATPTPTAADLLNQIVYQLDLISDYLGRLITSVDSVEINTRPARQRQPW